MLNINIIKDKSDLYFENNFSNKTNAEEREDKKNEFYHFVSSLCQRVISNDNSDFSKEEENLIEKYNIDVSDVLNYFKVDIKNFFVETGKTNS